MPRLDKAHARESNVLVQNEKTRLGIDKQSTESESVPLPHLLMGLNSGCRLCSRRTRLLTTLSIFEDHLSLDTLVALRSISPLSSSPGISATPTAVQEFGVLESRKIRLCDEDKSVVGQRMLLSSAAHSRQYVGSPLSATIDSSIRSLGIPSKHLLQTILLGKGPPASAGSDLQARSCNP